MRSTFSVIFYLKKDKVKKDGTSPIMGRITVDGTQAQFGTKTVHGWHYTTSKSPFKSLIDNAIAAFFRFSDFICTFIH